MYVKAIETKLPPNLYSNRFLHGHYTGIPFKNNFKFITQTYPVPVSWVCGHFCKASFNHELDEIKNQTEGGWQG